MKPPCTVARYHEPRTNRRNVLTSSSPAVRCTRDSIKCDRSGPAVSSTVAAMVGGSGTQSSGSARR